MSEYAKPRRRRVKKFRLDEISLVDRPAHGAGARIAIMKRAADAPVVDQIQKQMAVTSMVAGHAHIVVGRVANSEQSAELRAGQTSYAAGHSHDWILDDAGNVIIAENEGHSHAVAVLVMKAVAMPDGSFPIANTSDLKNAIQAFGRAKDKPAVAKHIRARARSLGATDMLPTSGTLADLLSKQQDEPDIEVSPEAVLAALGDHSASQPADESGNPIIEDTNVTTKNPAEPKAVTQDQLDEVTKRAARAEAIVKLSPDQRSHFDGLSPEKQDEFLAKSSDVRSEIVKNARDANGVVYTDRKGREFRKNDDPRLVEMAKDADAEAQELAKERALRKRDELLKRAGDLLKNCGGDLDVKAALLGAVEGISDVELRKGALAILTAKDAGLSKAFEEIGTSDSGNDSGNDAEQKIETLAKRERDANPNLTPEQAYARALETPEGRKLHAQLAS